MSTEFTLEQVLDFLDAEEVAGEFTDNPRNLLESDGISEPKPEKEQEKTTPLAFDHKDDDDDDAKDEEDDDEEENKSVDPKGLLMQEDDEEETEIDSTQAHFEFLKKNNLIIVPEEFEFDGSPEKLEEAYAITKQQLGLEAINSLWGRLTPEFQAALKYNLEGGADFQKFVDVYTNKTDANAYNLNSIDDQKKIVSRYYKMVSKYSDERIGKFINKLIETEDLKDEAEEALDYLKQHEQEQRQKLITDAETDRKDRETQAQQWRDSIADKISTSEIPEKRRSKVQAFLLNPVQRGDTVTTDFERNLRELFQNSDHYVQFADFLFTTYDPKKGLDFSKFIDSDKTKVTSKFQKELDEALRTPGKPKGATPQKPAKDTKLDWDYILNQLDN